MSPRFPKGSPVTHGPSIRSWRALTAVSGLILSAEVPLEAQPANGLLHKRPPQSLEAELTSHVDGRLVVELVRMAGTDLTPRPLRYGPLLTRCNAAAVQVVEVRVD